MELGANGTLGGGVAASDLHGEDTTEGSGTGGVGKLDKADVGLATNGTRAGGSGGDLDGEGVVLVDVGGTLHDAHADESTGPEGALLGGSNVTLGTGNLGGDLGLLARRESSSTGGVDDG